MCKKLFKYECVIYITHKNYSLGITKIWLQIKEKGLKKSKINADKSCFICIMNTIKSK